MLEDIAISIWRSIKWLLRGLGSMLLWVLDKIMLAVTGILGMIADIFVAVDFTGTIAFFLDRDENGERKK